jgi:hypothetical protein
LSIPAVTISLPYGIGQLPHLHQPGFHPMPICKRYGVGIPAELAKLIMAVRKGFNIFVPTARVTLAQNNYLNVAKDLRQAW